MLFTMMTTMTTAAAVVQSADHSLVSRSCAVHTLSHTDLLFHFPLFPLVHVMGYRRADNAMTTKDPVAGMSAPVAAGMSSSLTSLSKQSGKRARLIDLNEWISCYLCGGYLIDATTLVDCSTLHFFCRSCILKHIREQELMNIRPSCPLCETPMNESKPHTSLRLDKNYQDIIYKLVPGLYKSEYTIRL